MNTKWIHTALIVITSAALLRPVAAQGPGKGRGAGGGQDFQEAIHKLFENHKEIRRTVEMTADGYKARTVSDNPEIAKTIQKHVKEMRERLGAGMMIRRWDPAFAELVEHYSDIGHEFKDVDGGVEVVARGKTPEAVKVVQNHARIVSGFAEKGTEQMHATHPRALDAKKDAAGKADGKGKPDAAAPGCPKCAGDAAKDGEKCPKCETGKPKGDGPQAAPADPARCTTVKQRNPLMTLVWIFLAVGIVVAGWYWYEGRWDRQLFSAEPGHVCTNLTAKEARAWLEAHPETQVLDVRSADEFSKGALPGAVNISVGDTAFESKVSALNRQQPVLVYCAGGFRSRKAVERLKALGFENIQHLHRGYMSW